MRPTSPYAVVLVAFATIAIMIAGCGGGGTSGPIKLASNSTANVGASPTNTNLSEPSGYSANVGFPSTSDGSSGSIALNLTTSLPTGVSAPASMKRKPKAIGATVVPLVYVAATSNANVNFTSSPSFTFGLPPGISLAAGSSTYVAFWDPAQSATGWVTILGPGAVSGTTATFAATPGGFSLKSGTQYVFVLFTTSSPAVVAGLSGPVLELDLTQTNLPASTPVYIYVVGIIKSNSGMSYWLKPLQSASGGTPQAGSTVNVPVVAATMNPGSQSPPAGCTNNGDDVNFYSCNNNQLNSLPSPAATAINGTGGTSGNYPSAWADYSIPATVGTKLALNLNAISQIPGLGTGTSAFSGRIYISVGVPKMPLTALSGGSYIAPSFGNNAGQPGQYTLYDWIEFSYDSNGIFNGNTTQVNQFGIALQLSGNGVPAPQTLTQSRSTILNYVAASAPPYGGTGSALGNAVVATPAGAATAFPAIAGYLRAIAPQTIVAVGAYPSGGALAHTFDSYITAAYAAWQTTPLVTNDQGTGYYTGVVFPTTPTISPTPSGYPTGSLAFYKGQYTTMSSLVSAVTGGATPAFYLTGTGANQNIISSTDIWANDNSLTNGGTAQKNVGKILAAAFNRGIVVSPSNVVTTYLDDSTCSAAPVVNTFYPASGTWNPWAQYFHSISSPPQTGTSPSVGLSYAFSYDDVCSQNPSISFAPGTVTITVGNF